MAPASAANIKFGNFGHVLHEFVRVHGAQHLALMGNSSRLPASNETTSLVHESYLKLAKVGKLALENRSHFLSYAAHVMRSVVVDFIRHARAQRRGGGGEFHVTLNPELRDSLESAENEVLRLNDLLAELTQLDTRLVAVVEMRYFAALDTNQIAESLGVTSRTVLRDLEKVRLLVCGRLPLAVRAGSAASSGTEPRWQALAADRISVTNAQAHASYQRPVILYI